jgi:hypothetical protein
MKLRALMLTLGVAVSMPLSQTGAQTATDVNNQVTTMNNLTSNQGQTNVIGKISSDFTLFLGSDATAVVTGLRNGTPIKLTYMTTTPSSTPAGVPVTTTNTTVITPPTGQMGFGNVYISLALAKQQLSTLGITQPTQDQLKAALTGGTITQTTTGTGTTGTTTTTNLPGVLTMRSEHMGWGQIAQKLGFKLGPVMAAMKSGNQNLASAATSSSQGSSVVSANGNANGSSEHGIVSGSGKPSGNPAQGVSGGNSSSGGIVSASGKGNGNAYGLNRGSIVTGSGSPGGSSGGVVSARGSGNGAGNGKGPNK